MPYYAKITVPLRMTMDEISTLRAELDRAEERLLDETLADLDLAELRLELAKAEVS